VNTVLKVAYCLLFGISLGTIVYWVLGLKSNSTDDGEQTRGTGGKSPTKKEKAARPVDAEEDTNMSVDDRNTRLTPRQEWYGD
jgi:hypothetical protein